MAVTLGLSDLRGVLSMTDAIRLLEEMLAHEAAGRTLASPRFNADFEGGSMRILFAADYEAGYCATKAYHSVKGAGVRYIVTLYRLRDGELLALLDGSHITDLRTGAASGVVARRVSVSGPVTAGVIGSGHQARRQLESVASVYRLTSATVFSPTPAHRETFALEMSGELKIPIKVADSAEAAVRGRKVVIAASSSRGPDPVIRGAWLDACRLLCAVGNTRPQFAEVDAHCLASAALVVADTPHAFSEAGELRAAADSGTLPAEKRVTLAQLVSGGVKVPPRGMIAFKSVGSALQDLALAGRYYELLQGRCGAPAAADLASVRLPMHEIGRAASRRSRADASPRA
jgi:ornithine cyclodeaminase/alanine dehydrogenase-like protein (mu-crystallin family)